MRKEESACAQGGICLRVEELCFFAQTNFVLCTEKLVFACKKRVVAIHKNYFHVVEIYYHVEEIYYLDVEIYYLVEKIVSVRARQLFPECFDRFPVSQRQICFR